MAQEKLTLTFFKHKFDPKMFAEAGFDFSGISNNNGFVIYKKR